MSSLTDTLPLQLSGRDLARYIDHTPLKPEATGGAILPWVKAYEARLLVEAGARD